MGGLAEGAQVLTRAFGRFACIDWSGAKGRRQRGIAVATCEAGDAAPTLVAPPAGGWSRADVLAWLLALAEEEADLLIGIDFSPALPFDAGDGYLPGLAGVRDAPALWRVVDAACGNDDHLAATSFVARHAPHFRIGNVTGERFASADGNGRLRHVERACRADGLGAAQSCFNLVGAAQVGLSSLTGMRMLHRLAGRVPVWPFDQVPARGPLIVEIYTTIAARAAGIVRGSKMRDAAALDRALAAFGTAPHAPLPRLDDHATDAILTAAWLHRAASDDALWRPPPPTISATEGWTFGVPYRKGVTVPA